MRREHLVDRISRGDRETVLAKGDEGFDCIREFDAAAGETQPGFRDIEPAAAAIVEASIDRQEGPVPVKRPAGV